jgi:rhodanese-related sulfurtransferase
MMGNQSGGGMALMRNVLWLTVAGSLAACGGPAPESAVSAEALQKVAQGVARKEGRVAAEELARWIIEGRKDFVLIDIRSADAFALGHVQGAEHVPLTELVTPTALAGLPSDRKVIVYSQGPEETAAAATLLRLGGRDGVVLTGGYEAWSRDVLNPDIPAVATVGEAPALAEKRAIACYFVGGQGSKAEAPVYAPKPAPVAPPAAAAPAKTGPAAPRDGC